jgi:hypothetical protein
VVWCVDFEWTLFGEASGGREAANRGKGKGNTSKRAVSRDDATAQRLKPGKEKRGFRCVVAALREEGS